MRNNRISASILAAALAVSSVSSCVWAETETTAELAAGFSVVNLKTDGITDPLGIDDTTPSFSWQMESSAVGASQASYQIVVTDPEIRPSGIPGPWKARTAWIFFMREKNCLPVPPTAGRLR